MIDFHSGGKTLEFVPFCCAHILDDKNQQAQCVNAMQAFNAPYSMMLLEIEADSMYDTAAERMGKVFISTELGGGGTTTPRTVEIAKKGIRNVLRHAGITNGVLESDTTLNLDMPDANCYVFSESSGLVEPVAELGETLSAGDVICRVHDVERTGTPPVNYRAKIDGVLAGRHFPGQIAMGDFVAVIAVPI